MRPTRDEDFERDPGLARERTALSWNRSGLAVVVCVAVLLRHLWPITGPGRFVAVALVAAAAILWSVVLVIFSNAGAYRGEALVGPRVFGLMTLATETLAVVGFVLAIVAPA